MLASTTGSGAVVLATSPTLITPALGTPSALVGTNITGTAAGLSIGGNAATATTATNVSGGTSSVTSETVSGNLTLSGGTANGVAYLNGSKVVTSGSALTFDGTNFGVGANGTPTSGFQLGSPSINSSGTSNTLRVYRGGAAGQYAEITDFGGLFTINSVNGGGGGIGFQGDGSEQMRLNSTGLGIGTSSPGAKLDVYQGSAATGLQVYVNDIGTSNIVNFKGYDNSLGTVSRMVVQANGNVGIGITSPAAKLHVSGSVNTFLLNGSGTSSNFARFTSTGGDGVLGIESSAGGSIVTGASAYATVLYTVGSTALQFGTNSSIKATLDASGNLGLGVTPSAWYSSFKGLDVANAAYYGNISNGTAFITGNTYINSSLVNIYKTSNYALRYTLATDLGQHIWQIAPSGTAGTTATFTQAMTLDASGNLLVGTTTSALTLSGRGVVEINGSSSAVAALKVGDALKAEFYTDGTDLFITNDVNGAMRLYTNGSERARIDSSGNLLVGTTSTGYTSSNSTYYTPIAAYWINNHATGTASGTRYIGFGIGVNEIGSITQTGTTAVLYNTTSDQRLKENIEDATSASALIDSLQVRQYDWKSDGSHQRYGFVAQELVTVAPEAVHQPADPEEMMGVDYSKLVPMLVKEIQDLRKRLAALEAK
jgi:hypothetical protein